MLPFKLDVAGGVRIVALGAHPDDIEIGCGGTLRRLADSVLSLAATFVVATGDANRMDEARHGAELFLPGCDVTVRGGALPDGRLPAHWGELKELLESTARSVDADLVLTPRPDDKHQDHRLVAELATTVWRDHVVLNYEIPKWDGDVCRPWLYVPLSEEQLRTKTTLLAKAFPSQTYHDWFDEEVFTGLARLRGMECRAHYAEAFGVAKARLEW